MAIVDLFLSHPGYIAASIPVLVLLVHIVPWLVDSHSIRDIKGPWLAKFSDFWLGYWAAQGKRSEHVHEMHKKYGTFVRLAPNHVSIADSEALQTVYAHGNGTLKSNFYDAFVSLRRGLFNTRSRPEHTRKRKIVSHIFSQKNVLEFEVNVKQALLNLTKQWDRLCEGGVKGISGDEGEGGWKGHDGRVWFDCLPWFNYLAFDIIGDLAFGAPFGMLDACADSAPVAINNEAMMAQYGSTKPDAEAKEPEVMHVPAIQILNSRGEFSASMGVLPPWIRPLVKKIPWYAKGNQAVKNLAGIAVAAVAKRLAADAQGEKSERVDLLRRLQESRDDEGKRMGKEELTAEALTQLIAGSDTTSNSSCAITYHLAHNPAVQHKLQKELDDALGLDDSPVLSYEQIKSLPYLDAVINEGLRVHSTSAMGLPRLVPEGGITVLDRFFPEGTVLSVPSYTIHREKRTWGEDCDEFRPERWFERDQTDIQRCFNPFSYGPRACVGKNLATMELFMIMATVMRRYEFVLENFDAPFETREGFLRKPLGCRVGVRRRNLDPL
ncbi:cytochrome P450 monooxygenase pc-bph [Sistotremastrum niveocremeum HHB9708]|uniref:Cytochrome P450 monooxygenase pc-bph n=1 Tax=Sistotremastrum niveocremeum HHB9708 TaxID=1314777 RepID=A0A165A073_9AGAM|nr:cytochrome P450 monooxygenase pc-bph [Sistotremastrum niveocremeum HHB9708]